MPDQSSFLAQYIDPLKRLAAHLFYSRPSAPSFVISMTKAEYEARLKLNVAASDPAVVAKVESGERKLGIVFKGGPYTPYESRAAVVDHLLNPADPRFHTDDVRYRLLSYRTSRADLPAGFRGSEYPHPTSPIFPSPLDRRPRLLVDNERPTTGTSDRISTIREQTPLQQPVAQAKEVASKASFPPVSRIAQPPSSWWRALLRTPTSSNLGAVRLIGPAAGGVVDPRPWAQVHDFAIRIDPLRGAVVPFKPGRLNR